MSDQDPTRPQRPVEGGETPHDPTSVIRTTETTEPRPVPADPRPPGGGVAVGVAVAAALVVGLLGLLAGYLLFEDDDGDDEIEAVEDTAPPGADPTEVEAERDALAQQVEDLNAQVEDLQSQLDTVTQERDELQAQLEEATTDDEDQIQPVEAPDVVGGAVSDAESVADDNGWILVERTVESGPGDAEPGSIVAQYPEPGGPMVEGSVLVVDVLQEAGGE